MMDQTNHTPTIFDIWNSHWTLSNVGGKDNLWKCGELQYIGYYEHIWYRGGLGIP